MIDPFLYHLPRYLKDLMKREYDAKCRQLARWRVGSRSERLRPYLKQEAVLHQLIALGIYYRYVIAPLTSAGDFVRRLVLHDLGLQVAGQRIGSDLHDQLQAGRLQFYSLARTFGLEEEFFAISDLQQMVMNLVRLEERRHDGPI